jgi:hypothetical protein
MYYARSDIVLSRDFLLCIYIDLHKGNMIHARQACRQLFIDGGNGLARTTPICIDFSRSVQVILDAASNGRVYLPKWRGRRGSLQSVTTIFEDFRRSLNC